MINPTGIRILNRVNERSLESGIDTYDTCFDKTWFSRYRHKITYEFNSRGFRDTEWPEDLDNVIWCIGDSFTSGVGVPYKHTWPQILERKLGRQCINVSLDGASNNWIARQAQTLINEIAPKALIIQWSFAQRREQEVDGILDQAWQKYYQEIRGPRWPNCPYHKEFNTLPEHIQQEIKQDPKFSSWHEDVDLDSERRLHYIKSTPAEDLKNTQACIDSISYQTTTKIIHSFIPDWSKSWHKLKFHDASVIKPIKQIDVARDGFHYDIKTATAFVQELLPILGNMGLTCQL